MTIPNWLVAVFLFAFGCCTGSFLNVVIYRLPKGRSIVSPASACPNCGVHIAWYDNIPLLSWLILGARCRHCKARISARYIIVELLTGLVFLGLYLAYFQMGIREGMPGLTDGGWLVYLSHLALLAGLLSASAIDLELWVIPLQICWFATAVGLIAAASGPLFIPAQTIRLYGLLPVASPTTGAMAAGGAIGLVIGLICLEKGWISRSYQQTPDDPAQPRHRHEVIKELAFLAPIVTCGLIALALTRTSPIGRHWHRLMALPPLAGLLGSGWGYLVGCGLVWATRIAGTLAFGKEAMGLGDVHLMGAVGAVLGPIQVILGFFIAPFLGLAWAATQMLYKKIHEIPYGPFLSIATALVMLFYDGLMDRLRIVFGRY